MAASQPSSCARPLIVRAVVCVSPLVSVLPADVAAAHLCGNEARVGAFAGEEEFVDNGGFIQALPLREQNADVLFHLHLCARVLVCLVVCVRERRICPLQMRGHVFTQTSASRHACTKIYTYTLPHSSLPHLRHVVPMPESNDVSIFQRASKGAARISQFSRTRVRKLTVCTCTGRDRYLETRWPLTKVPLPEPLHTSS